VARLATVSAAGVPHLVPITFALLDERIVVVVDDKPKTTTRLRRLDNLAANPAVCVHGDVTRGDVIGGHGQTGHRPHFPVEHVYLARPKLARTVLQWWQRRKHLLTRMVSQRSLTRSSFYSISWRPVAQRPSVTGHAKGHIPGLQS